MDLEQESRRDLQVVLLLVAVAVVLHLPGIGWGLPQADAPGKTRPWGLDEIGPIGPIVELANTFLGTDLGDAQYPLFHYIFVAVFYAPYLLFELATRGLVHPHAGYPFGFQDPAAGVHALLLIARSVSVLMSAGIVVAAFLTGKTLWGRRAGIIAAVFVMLMYPMFYYGRLSNVDVPALFWVSLALLLFARAMRDGLPVRRALWLGLFAALAVGTKDQSYGILLFLPLAILPVHFRVLREQGLTDLWSRWKAPFAGAAVSAVAYGVASGLLLRPAKFFWHLSFIRGGAPHYRFYFKYPGTPAGYTALCREALGLVISSVGWPVFVAAGVGVLLCLIHDRSKLALLLPFPGLFLGVLAPVRFVELRFLMPWAYIVALFAGYAVTWGIRSSRRPIQALAMLLLVSGCGLGLLRGADLTYALLRDSRYEAARWIEAHVQDGEQLQYYSIFSPHLTLLPRTRPGPVWSSFWTTRNPSKEIPQAQFVFLFGPEDLENHLGCPAWLYERLKNGSLEYEPAATFKTPTLFSHPDFLVNPRIEIYARRDRAQRVLP